MEELVKRDLKLKVTTKNKPTADGCTQAIEQKQSRELRKEILGKVVETISEKYDIACTIADGGAYIEIPNTEDGAIIVNLDIKVKPLDLDIDTLKSEYEEKQEKAKEKAEKKKTTEK